MADDGSSQKAGAVFQMPERGQEGLSVSTIGLPESNFLYRTDGTNTQKWMGVLVGGWVFYGLFVGFLTIIDRWGKRRQAARGR